MPSPDTKSRRVPFWLLILGVGFICALSVLLSPILFPTSRGVPCIVNLKLIDSAKEQYALEHQLTAASPVTFEAIKPYLIGHQIPVCPVGGKYAVTVVSNDPTCTVEGHSLR